MNVDILVRGARNRGLARTLLIGLIIAIVCLGSVFAQEHVAGSQTGSGSVAAANQVAWLQYISVELRRIHIEVLEDRRDMQQARLQDLERDLESVRIQQQQLQDEMRSQTQQATDIEAQLAGSSLTKEDRAELEAQRAELLAVSPSRFGTVHNALAEREARARERLAQQEQRVRDIDRQVKELTAGSQ